MASTTQQQRTTTLRTTTHAFLSALLSPPHPSTLIAQYFTSQPSITEHGPSWAHTRLPFLGKTFTGKDGCEEYFMLMGSTLRLELTAESLPGPEGFVVDAEAGAVSVVGKAYVESRKTGKGFQETFIHRFSGFDDEGRIGHWEIWADALSAWEAVGSE